MSLQCPNVKLYYGRLSQFALIRFHARRLDDSISLLISNKLESWISEGVYSSIGSDASAIRY